MPGRNVVHAGSVQLGRDGPRLINLHEMIGYALKLGIYGFIYSSLGKLVGVRFDEPTCGVSLRADLEPPNTARMYFAMQISKLTNQIILRNQDVGDLPFPFVGF